MTLAPLTFLFMEGDPGDKMYIIRKGRIRILKREGAQMATLAELGPGSILGEMSLLDNQPRSATAKTLETTELVIIDQSMLENTYKALPGWLTSIIRMVVQRLRETTARKYREDVSNALAGALFLLDCDAQKAPENPIPVQSLAERIRTIYGLSYSDLGKLLSALESLGLVTRTSEDSVLTSDPALVHATYQALLDRASPKPTYAQEINEAEGLLLEAMLKAGESVPSGESKQIRIAYDKLPNEPQHWINLGLAQHIQWSPTLQDGISPDATHLVVYDPNKVKLIVNLNKILPKLTKNFSELF